jgi:hypothetical protein
VANAHPHGGFDAVSDALGTVALGATAIVIILSWASGFAAGLWIDRCMRRDYPELLDEIDPGGYRTWNASSQVRLLLFLLTGRYRGRVDPDLSRWIAFYRVSLAVFTFAFVLTVSYGFLDWKT